MLWIPRTATVSLLILSLTDAISAQSQPARLSASPAEITMTVGETASLRITAYNAAGALVDVPIRVAAPRESLRFADGTLTALQAGVFEIVATTATGTPRPGAAPPASVTISVTVRWPPVTRIEITASPGRLYHGTPLQHTARAFHADGSIRPNPEVVWTTSNPSILTADPFGQVLAHGTGPATLTARFGSVTETLNYDVAPFPGTSLTISGGDLEVRTGDVQNFTAQVVDASGTAIPDVPVTWSHTYRPAPGVIAPSAPGQMVEGKMVADVPGIYTAIAQAGPLTARRSFRVVKRDVVQKLTVVGQGRQATHYTSDLWLFEGVDGRDYALTGARQAQSHAFVWDITNPADIHKIDSIQVDARSVNDVKVSPDARYGVISREGASNRRNGLVILDLANPAHPVIAAEYDEDLTGGVHNVFALNDYLFALSGGDKYIVLDMSDIYHPSYVSEYNHPDSRVHDVWVHNGIAYTAEWETGIVATDVGNGRWGGSIDNPTLITTIPLPTGATHAVFPYYQESTGRFLLFVGDEITNRRGLAWEGSGPDVRMAYDPETGRGGYPRATSGYIQIIDFTDPEDARMIARYEVAEFGTHNIWVEDDKLYQAYYEGGVRIVDVSGELMGNLYTQGREIAVYKAHDPVGWIANAPAAWSVIPYKGNVFFSDISSGMWSVKLEPKQRPVM